MIFSQKLIYLFHLKIRKGKLKSLVNFYLLLYCLFALRAVVEIFRTRVAYDIMAARVKKTIILVFLAISANYFHFFLHDPLIFPTEIGHSRANLND